WSRPQTRSRESRGGSRSSSRPTIEHSSFYRHLTAKYSSPRVRLLTRLRGRVLVQPAVRPRDANRLSIRERALRAAAKVPGHGDAQLGDHQRRTVHGNYHPYYRRKRGRRPYSLPAADANSR